MAKPVTQKNQSCYTRGRLRGSNTRGRLGGSYMRGRLRGSYIRGSPRGSYMRGRPPFPPGLATTPGYAGYCSEIHCTALCTAVCTAHCTLIYCITLHCTVILHTFATLHCTVHLQYGCALIKHRAGRYKQGRSLVAEFLGLAGQRTERTRGPREIGTRGRNDKRTRGHCIA